VTEDRAGQDDRATMQRSILSQVAVIDDFMPDFEAFRARALEAEYKPLGGGMLETGLYTEYFGEPSVIERIAAVVGYPLVPADPKGTGRFSLRTSRMNMGLDIHADACLLGGILYLNRAEHCQGGTSVFRHRATGLFAFPNEAEQAGLGLASDATGYFDYFCRKEGMDRGKWEEVARAEMKPNRLVLIGGGLFHSHSSVFGNDLADGRLVQLYFLNARE
jgi:hypothetical protein